MPLPLNGFNSTGRYNLELVVKQYTLWPVAMPVACNKGIHSVGDVVNIDIAMSVSRSLLVFLTFLVSLSSDTASHRICIHSMVSGSFPRDLQGMSFTFKLCLSGLGHLTLA